MRIIQNLQWAKKLDRRPDCLPPVKHLRGSRRVGLKFEADLTRNLPGAIHGQWFQYCDSVGTGFCQPDILLFHLNGTIAVLECKLSQQDSAFQQLQSYKMVVGRAFQRKVIGIQVTKNLRPYQCNIIPKICNNLPDALKCAVSQEFVLLHWLGIPAQLQLVERHFGIQ